MRSREHKLIFIHIPKCAGSSIEKLFDVGYSTKGADVDSLYGWDTERKLHLQHATPIRLVELGLISKAEWDSYYTFTIIRNPWERAVSDYFWIMHDCSIRGSFKQYLEKKGPFEVIIEGENSENSRSDHWASQSTFLKTNNLKGYDKIIRLEELNDVLPEILNKIGLNAHEIPWQKRSKIKRFRHYSQLFTKQTLKIFDKYYKNDIETLGYQFETRPLNLKEHFYRFYFNSSWAIGIFGMIRRLINR